MSTLYRDYRPQKFADILGQNHLKIILQNELSEDKLSQAYLFCGPRAVGKTSMARILAQAVNCENRKTGESEPCGQCNSCLNIKNGKSLDVIEIDAASNTGVDNVRDNIIASARLAPSGKMRVFIIDEVHMLSLSAFNALLKIIEEPPKHVLFILCTTEVHKIPTTIISRCQRFDFKRISQKEIVKKLSFIISQEKIEISREVLESIAQKSGGHLRDAENLLGQILALGEKRIGIEEAELVLPKSHNQEALDLIDFLVKKNLGGAISLINQLADNGINFKNFLEEILFILRKIMLQLTQPGLAEKLGLDLGESLELRINNLSSELSLANCLRIMNRFLNLTQEKSSFIPQLPFEIAITELYLQMQSFDNKLDNKVKTNKNLIKENTVISKEKMTDSSNIIAADLSEAEVAALWPEVLVKIKKHNHSLSFILQNCLPRALKSGIITLCFKYKFHKDRILDPTIKSIFEKTLAEVFQGKVMVEALLDENLNLDINSSFKVESDNFTSTVTEENKTEGVLDNLMKNFGAEVL